TATKHSCSSDRNKIPPRRSRNSRPCRWSPADRAPEYSARTQTGQGQTELRPDQTSGTQQRIPAAPARAQTQSPPPAHETAIRLHPGDKGSPVRPGLRLPESGFWERTPLPVPWVTAEVRPPTSPAEDARD